MDTCCESRFHKKVFWKVKVPTADSTEDPTDDFVLLIGPVTLRCYLKFWQNLYDDPNKIGVSLTLTGNKTIFEPDTNVSAKFEIVGTKLIISVTQVPDFKETLTTMYLAMFCYFDLPISYENLRDPSNGFIIDEMFTFFIHVGLVLPKAVGSCCQKALIRVFGGNKDLALAAKKYQVGALQELCRNHMLSSLSVENVLEFLAIADLLNEKKLMKECLDLIGYIKDILSLMTPEWEKLTPRLLELIGQHKTNLFTSNTSICFCTRPY